ncbi:MAG: hypothetical protein FAF03_03120 [Epsilonproteobacteria bacterium]|nr:hypothetical protein [Campylobacterota bacterium]
MSDNIRYYEAFKIKATALKELGVYDGYINRDSEYYVLPHLFEGIKVKEFKDSYVKYKSKFEKIIKILKYAKEPTVKDTFFRQALKEFEFHELAHVGLGYSKTNKRGSGIGKVFAMKLAKTAYDIVKAGIEDPEIFELIGLLEEGIGADRISDMFISILTDDFLEYTQRIATTLKLTTKPYDYKSKKFNIPFYSDAYIVFVPTEVLVKLPISFDRDDISTACAHNEKLRSKVNHIISTTFSGSKLEKSRLKSLLIHNPDLLKELIRIYQSKVDEGYDFVNDPSGNFIWKELAQEYSADYPLVIADTKKPIEVVQDICEHYKSLVEDNGLFKMFHNADGSYRPESFSQMLYFAIADSYCTANDLDISPESDAGRGPVDFKVSKGSVKVNVEMKLSRNLKLLHGYKTQLLIYDKAEKTNNSIFFIVLLDESHLKRIKTVYDYKSKHETATNKLPEIVVVDATLKKSASKS